MIIYPAIDIKDGQCVRLKQGKMDEVTKFSDNPVEKAREFEAAGFSWLHIVDLDGAVKGRMINKDKIIEIIKSVNLNVQIGGGIRTIEAIDDYIAAGAQRVILGTVAITDFALLEEACRKYPGKIAVGIDARSNKVAIDGWVNESDVYVLDLINKLEKVGVSAIIYTDITKDGLLAGYDELGSAEIAKSFSIPLIISGGVSSLADLNKVQELEKHSVNGVIVGRAFYDKRISYEDALVSFS